MAARPSTVEVASATKTYPDGTDALAAVDLRLHDGEFVTLIGPSGCGKSTLLRLIAGLTPPTAGTVRRSAATLGYVFQNATLMPWARVSANVRLPLDLARTPVVESTERVSQALALVGLSSFARHYPRQLSGGMQMRVSIARALVNDPKLLLMDEPFGALDEITRNRLDEELLSLHAKRGFTALFVTHSIYEAVFLSTRVIVMTARPGRILGEVGIGEAYPREAGFRASPVFAEHCRRLSSLLAQANAAQERVA